MSRRSRLVDKVLSAPVGVTAACLFLAIILGCMNLEIGNRKIEAPPCEEGVLCQQGEAHVPENSSVFVRYPIPYVHKPNLEISCTFDDCVIEDEETDGFHLKNPNCFSRKVKWKARGMKCDPTPPPPPNPPPPPPPASGTSPTLPPPTAEHNT